MQGSSTQGGPHGIFCASNTGQPCHIQPSISPSNGPTEQRATGSLGLLELMHIALDLNNATAARAAFLVLVCPGRGAVGCSQQYRQSGGLTGQILGFAARVLWAAFTAEAAIDDVGCLVLQDSADSAMHGSYVSRKRCRSQSASCLFRSMRRSPICAPHLRPASAEMQQEARRTLRRLSRYTVSGELVRLLFAPNAWLQEHMAELDRHVGPPAAIALHVRRGDKFINTNPMQLMQRQAASELAAIVQRAARRSGAGATADIHLMTDDPDLAYDLAALLPRRRVRVLDRGPSAQLSEADINQRLAVRRAEATRAGTGTDGSNETDGTATAANAAAATNTDSQPLRSAGRSGLHRASSPCGLPLRFEPARPNANDYTRHNVVQPPLPPCASGEANESRPSYSVINATNFDIDKGALMFAELSLMARSPVVIASTGSNMGVVLLTLAEAAHAEHRHRFHFYDLDGQMTQNKLNRGTYFCDLPFGWRYLCGPGGATCHPDGLKGGFALRHDGEFAPLFKRACIVPAGSSISADPDWVEAWRRPVDVVSSPDDA